MPSNRGRGSIFDKVARDVLEQAKKQSIIKHNKVAEQYKTKHLYFVPQMRRTQFQLLPDQLKSIFANESPELKKLKDGVLVGIGIDNIDDFNTREWIDTKDDYWMSVSPKFRKYQEKSRKHRAVIDEAIRSLKQERS
jgi:hypothetical protein